jgi:Carbohydrate esterase, sialic acid-specific acetylesterase
MLGLALRRTAVPAVAATMMTMIGFAAGDAAAADVTATTAASPALAPTVISLVNPAFEAPALGDGRLSGQVPQGWSGGRAFNPSASAYPGLKPGSATIGTMSGPNVLTFADTAGVATQSTGVKAVAWRTYTLTVGVGGRSSGTFGGALLGITAGGVRITSRAVAAPPKAGTFGDVVLTWTAPPTATGKPVGVSLAMTGSGAGRYVDLDNVRFTVGPISAVGVLAPVTRQIVQRDAKGLATMYVSGIAPPGTLVRARLVARAGKRGATTTWATMASTATGGPFHGWIRSARAGWYDLTVQQLRGGVVRASRTVERIGVGEIFIAAGQSNSANFGTPAQTPSDERVSALTLGLKGWQLAADPQPNAGGTMGSPWPDFGATFAASTGIPVAVVAVGISRTEVAQWQPGGPQYAGLRAAITRLGPNGFRAVLWHQGETDAAGCTSTDSYTRLLHNIITTSRNDAGFAVRATPSPAWTPSAPGRRRWCAPPRAPSPGPTPTGTAATAGPGTTPTSTTPGCSSTVRGGPPRSRHGAASPPEVCPGPEVA